MFAVQLSRDYLSGFPTIANLKYNDGKTNAYAVGKIFTYALLLPPILASVIGYGIPAIFPTVEKQYPKYRIKALANDLLRNENLSPDSKSLLTNIKSKDVEPSQVKPCCKSALELLEANNKKDAKNFLEIAKLCAKLSESDVKGFISNLFDIAVVEQRIIPPNAVKTIKEAVACIEKLDAAPIDRCLECSDRFEHLFISQGQYEIAIKLILLARELFDQSGNQGLSKVQNELERMEARSTVLKAAISVLALSPKDRKEKEKHIQEAMAKIKYQKEHNPRDYLSNLFIIAFVQKHAGYEGFRKTLRDASEITRSHDELQNIAYGFAYLDNPKFNPNAKLQDFFFVQSLTSKERDLIDQIKSAPDNERPQYVQSLCSLAIEFSQKIGDISKATHLIGLAKVYNYHAKAIDHICNLLIIARTEDQLKLESKISTANSIGFALKDLEPGVIKTQFIKDLAKLIPRHQLQDILGSGAKLPEESLLNRLVGILQEKFA